MPDQMPVMHCGLPGRQRTFLAGSRRCEGFTWNMWTPNAAERSSSLPACTVSSLDVCHDVLPGQCVLLASDTHRHGQQMQARGQSNGSSPRGLPPEACYIASCN